MNTVIQVEVPTEFRNALTDETGEAALPRWALEALVVEAVREGLVSRGFGGELLGLGFHQREAFYASRGVTYDLSDEELAEDRRAFDHILRAR